MLTNGAFDPETRAAILGANLGMCAGCDAQATDAHHRRPRGMGGTSHPDIGDIPNGLPLCRMCHMWAERHRGVAYNRGWLLGPSDPPDKPWWTNQFGWRAWVQVTDQTPTGPVTTWLVASTEGEFDDD